MPVPDPLHAVLYRSIASQTFAPGELLSLVEHAQARNASLGITGILLHGSMRALPHVPGAFVQWIEGPEGVVHELYRTVAADRRHHEVEVLADASLASLGINERLFGRWAMGLKSMSELPASLGGFLSVYRGGSLDGVAA